MIVDLSRYKEGKVGCRWRHKKEVLLGKGEIVCGNKHCFNEKCLEDYEFVFKYIEVGESLQALVKVKLCSNCEPKMRFKVVNC